MIGSFLKLFLLTLVFLASSLAVSAQVDASLGSPSDRKKPDEQDTKTLKDMLTKQRLIKEKKDHDEMLRRGEEALTISGQLEKAFESTNNVSAQDKRKLSELEKIVTKIRNELGGDDTDDDDVENSLTPNAQPKPSTLKEAFTYLKSTTVQLVDELKKTSRFSISAVAIQSSNSVLKLVRFLRLRR